MPREVQYKWCPDGWGDDVSSEDEEKLLELAQGYLDLHEQEVTYEDDAGTLCTPCVWAEAPQQGGLRGTHVRKAGGDWQWLPFEREPEEVRELTDRAFQFACENIGSAG